LTAPFDILVSLLGVGEATVFAMLIEMPERRAMEHKCAASPAGLAPMAPPAPRQAVHPWWTCPSAPSALYAGSRRGPLQRRHEGQIQRLHRAGKTSKVALPAITRKLIILGNALLRDGRTWSPSLTKTDTLATGGVRRGASGRPANVRMDL
jgi:transposase